MSANTIPNEGLKTGKVARAEQPRWQNIVFWGMVIALVIVAIAMRLYQLGVPFDRDGYDEGVYWQSLRAMSAGFTLYHQIFYSQPPFFLLSTYPFFTIFGSTLWSARLGIALVSLLGLPGAYLLGKSSGGRVGVILALLLVIVNPIYLTQSQTIEAEVSSAAFSLLTVGAAYLWWDNPEGVQGVVYAIICGVTLSLGILCKLLGFSCLIPIGLLMLARLWLVWRKQSGATSASVRAMVTGAIACIVTFAILIVPFIGAWHDMIQGVVTFHTHAGTIFGQQPGIIALKKQYFQTFFTSQFALILAACLGTLIALIRRNWKVVPLLAWLLVSLYLLWITTPLFYRHLIALVPPLIGLAILGLEGLPTIEGVNALIAKIVPALAVLLILVAAGINVGQDVMYYNNASQQSTSAYTRLEAHVATDLRNTIAPNQVVITDAQFVAALADRSTPPSLVDTSTVRIESGYVTLHQLENEASQPDVHAVLFFTNRLLTLPSVAPFHAWVAQHFHLKYTYGPGQELWVR
ncbi:MAG: phospholipid carrier-dependent glycosyltransferase [Ktedonobacteraceae bacterium]